MSPEILTKSLWDQRRAFLGWGIGLGAAAAVYTGFFAVVEPDTFAGMLDTFPPDLLQAFGWTDISSPSGYLGATVYGLVVPILTIVFAIAVGTRYLAGDEEAGTLELTITQPVSRTSVFLQRAAAMAVAGFGAAAVVLVVVLALRAPVGLEIQIGNIAASSLQLALLAVVFGSLALMVGAVRGRRGVVLGVSAAVAVFAYFADTVIPQVEGLAWLENLSFFNYYDGAAVLKDGLDPAKTLVLIASALILVGIGAIAFNRRDIGT
ncbi:MAG: ABC transporter permease subunit [Acidimicrobiia bacterium]